jgi:hypothetical protein
VALPQIVKTIWNGPFSLGPLTKPVAPMDAIVKVLEIVWKAGVSGLTAFALFCAVILSLLALGLIR